MKKEPPVKITIRHAVDHDFESIWDIFHHVVATGDTYAYSPDTSKEEAYGYWMPPQKKTYVATINDEVVGTYFIKENQPGLGSHIANAAYMVHPEQHGKGIGLSMAMHSIDEARSQNYSAMQFNLVVSTNEPAVHLWKKMGFKIIGTTPHGFRHSSKGLIDTYILHRFL
jgi:L-amino acid N-acyltransferase YncA